MRRFVATCALETHTISPLPTDRRQSEVGPSMTLLVAKSFVHHRARIHRIDER